MLQVVATVLGRPDENIGEGWNAKRSVEMLRFVNEEILRAR